MRRYWSWLTAGALALGFVACKERDERTTTYESPTRESAQAEMDDAREVSKIDLEARAERAETDLERARDRARANTETFGDRMEDDLDRAGDRIERTGERAERELKEAGDDIERDAERAGDKFEKSADEARAELRKINLTSIGESLKLDADAEVLENNKLVLRVKNAKPGDYDVILGENCSTPAKARDLNAADEKGVGTATILASQKRLGELKVSKDGTGRMEASLPKSDRTIRVQALIVKPEDKAMEDGAMCGMLTRLGDDSDRAG